MGFMGPTGRPSGWLEAVAGPTVTSWLRPKTEDLSIAENTAPRITTTATLKAKAATYSRTCRFRASRARLASRHPQHESSIFPGRRHGWASFARKTGDL